MKASQSPLFLRFGEGWARFGGGFGGVRGEVEASPTDVGLVVSPQWFRRKARRRRNERQRDSAEEAGQQEEGWIMFEGIFMNKYD